MELVQGVALVQAVVVALVVVTVVEVLTRTLAEREVVQVSRVVKVDIMCGI